MSIAMTRDDALSGLLGGALIGSAAAVLLLFNGDVLGASGIITSCSLNPIKALTSAPQHWKFVFLASFLLTSNLATSMDSSFQPEAPTLSALGYAIAGFLVGFGTKLGNGCTSGHGICGLPRFSKRSLTAVLTFMGFGAATTVYSKGLFPIDESTSSASGNTERMGSVATVLGLVALGSAVAASWFHECGKQTYHRAKHAPAAVSGALFAKGLQISGMIMPSKVWSFLDVTLIPEGAWNPQLAMVMGGGVLISFIAYQYVGEFSVLNKNGALTCPLMQPKDKNFPNLPKSQVIDFNLVAGAALFGTGWGLAGMCPGPALFLAGAGVPAVLTQWLPSFWVGSFLANAYKERTAA